MSLASNSSFGSFLRRSLVWGLRGFVATLVLAGIAPALGLILLLTFPLLPFVALPFVLSALNVFGSLTQERAPSSAPPTLRSGTDPPRRVGALTPART